MKKAITSALVLALMSASGATYSASLDTTSAAPNDDGVLQNFLGIDWHENASGWVQGFDLTAASNIGDMDTFTFTYQAFAGSIATSSLYPNLRVGLPGPAVGGYELTTYQTITEKATCTAVNCTSISIALVSGTWDVYFDITPDANTGAGTGFLDGVKILSGTWDTGFTNFGANAPVGTPGAMGTGGGAFTGTVTMTDNAYVNPDLLGTDLQASLFFPGIGSYTRSAAFNGVSTGTDTPTNFVLQTDTSQSFTQVTVPEPSVVAIMGAGLLGVGFARRRRKV
ncbi:MAG: flocculation-associated PEP-CTERM protein PepA [Gammaproteobacteria bacterium]|nr:flocculation-associated PEP-CTERM protein PepA [Gammaproteobacteria bacterium]